MALPMSFESRMAGVPHSVLEDLDSQLTLALTNLARCRALHVAADALSSAIPKKKGDKATPEHYRTRLQEALKAHTAITSEVRDLGEWPIGGAIPPDELFLDNWVTSEGYSDYVQVQMRLNFIWREDKLRILRWSLKMQKEPWGQEDAKIAPFVFFDFSNCGVYVNMLEPQHEQCFMIVLNNIAQDYDSLRKRILAAGG